MLEARELIKCYASLPAVSEVSFTVRPGVCGILRGMDQKLLRKRADALLASRLAMRKFRDDDGSGHSLVFEGTGDSPFEPFWSLTAAFSTIL